ncbi:KR domain-containing protein [Hypoxylon cercidicola]|nr:KR domain-containing protein [Hypoxylon cercidicola]
MLGAEIYVTVGNEKKAQYLIKAFGFQRERIFNSRDSSFVEGIMRETNGTGADVVLNSLSGELLHESWKCVAKFGCMIELGLRDSHGSGRLDMLPFGDNRSYHDVYGSQFTARPAIWRRVLESFIQFAEAGLLHPIRPLTVFPAGEIQQAFRFLGDASHIGKTVVTLPPISPIVNLSPYVPRIAFNPAASYLLTGGVGGLGRAIATWMVEHGARHLTFLSRSAGSTDTSRALLVELEEMGCSVTSVSGYADKMNDVHEAIMRSKHPIKGVLHLAMVLRDVSLMDMSWSEWQDVLKPKVEGAWNLHSAFLTEKQDLDFFFLASSIISVLDSVGQANYVAANAVNESFSQYRRSLGLPTSVLNICPIEDIGFVAENEQAALSVRAQGLLGVDESGFLECLELSMLQCQASLPAQNMDDALSLTPWTIPGQIVMGLHTDQDLDDPKCRTMWRGDRRMGAYHNGIVQVKTASTKNNLLQEFLALLDEKDGTQTLQDEETIVFLASEIGRKIYGYLFKPNENVDAELSVEQMGLDSLLSIELARWFQTAFNIKMNALEITGSGTLKKLASNIAKKLSRRYNGTKVDGGE